MIYLQIYFLWFYLLQKCCRNIFLHFLHYCVANQWARGILVILIFVAMTENENEKMRPTQVFHFTVAGIRGNTIDPKGAFIHFYLNLR